MASEVGGGAMDDKPKGLTAAHRRTGNNLSSSSLMRKRSDFSLLSKVRCGPLRRLLASAAQVLLATKLSSLFFAVPLAVAAHYYRLGHAWVFALSLIGLTPLAERMSFLSEQIAYCAGPTAGGILNATCGNVPELIIALLALQKDKIEVLKCSLLGSILSNLLLVLGSSLFCGGLANQSNEKPFDRRQAHVNMNLLLMSAVCHIFSLVYRSTTGSGEHTEVVAVTLRLSRSWSILMLLAYFACLVFQLKTHRQLFEAQEEESDSDDVVSDEPVIGFASACAWLIAMTVVITILSDYIVGTIEAASKSWGVSISFISIILLPIAANATEHAAAIIFAFRNKIDITLGISLGSATQISLFVIPLSIIAAWIKGIQMDIDFNLLETGSMALAILIMAFILLDGTWHYMKGFVLLLCYTAISALFFSIGTSDDKLGHVVNLDAQTT